MPLIIFAIFLIVAAVLLTLRGRNARQEQGLPPGKVIYDDATRGGEEAKALYSARLGLSGKPDYLVRRNGTIIPVEVKSQRAPNQPYDSHIYQLAAYCMLVEDCLGSRPPFGIIRYNDRSFQIDYTDGLEQSLDELLAAMREHKLSVCPPRSHQQPARCAGCGYADICKQALQN